MDQRLRLVRVGLLMAGALFLVDTLFGLIAMLGIGFDTVQDVVLVLCLTMAFPIYLVGLYSLGAATILLWFFFLAQWVDTCFNGVTPSFVNPFDWWYGDTVFVAALIVQLSYIALRRAGFDEYVALLDVLRPKNAEA